MCYNYKDTSGEQTAASISDTSQGAPSAPEQKDKTLFIYMCGSNLETKKGLAGKNIDEILSADIYDDMNIVIETGGALEWQSYGIDSSVLSRYELSVSPQPASAPVQRVRAIKNAIVLLV